MYVCKMCASSFSVLKLINIIFCIMNIMISINITIIINLSKNISRSSWLQYQHHNNQYVGIFKCNQQCKECLKATTFFGSHTSTEISILFLYIYIGTYISLIMYTCNSYKLCWSFKDTNTNSISMIPTRVYNIILSSFLMPQVGNSYPGLLILPVLFYSLYQITYLGTLPLGYSPSHPIHSVALEGHFEFNLFKY